MIFINEGEALEGGVVECFFFKLEVKKVQQFILQAEAMETVTSSFA